MTFEVAEKSINNGLMNSTVLFGFLLLTIYFWRWEHLK
jgi:hypothetical protein